MQDKTGRTHALFPFLIVIIYILSVTGGGQTTDQVLGK